MAAENANEEAADVVIEAGSAPRRKKQNLFTSNTGQEATVDFVPRKAAALRNGQVVDLTDAVENKPWFIISPLSQSRMSWDAIAMCFIAFQAVLIPAEVAFAQPEMSLSVPYNAWWIVDFIIGLFFVVDFALNCVTGFLTEEGMHVWGSKRILRHYFLRFPFHGICDLISLMPFFFLIVEAGVAESTPEGYVVAKLGRASRLARFFRYATVLKMLRLVRITRAAGIARKMSETLIFTGRYSSAAWSFLSVAFWFGLIVHFVCCILALASEDFGAALYSEDTPYSADPGANAWEQYTYAVWWTVMTFAGGSPPTNPTGTWDFWLYIIITFFFVLAVNVSVGVFCAVVDKFMQDERDLHDQLEVAMRFVTTHRLSEGLKSRVLGTIRNAHVQQRVAGTFEESIEPLLSEDLRRKLKGAMYNNLLKRFPPFQNMSTSFLNSIASEAAYTSYAANDRIFKEGEPADSMIFMTSGAAMMQSKALKFQMPNVSSGWWLHERAVLCNSENPAGNTRPFTCVCLQPSSVLEISREVFQDAMQCQTGTRESLVVPPWCPVCGENHDVWDCQVLVPVEVDSEDESGETRLEELGKAGKEMYEKHCKKKLPSTTRAAAPASQEAVIAGPAVPVSNKKSNGDEALLQVAETLQQLVSQVRTLEVSLGGRLSTVEAGIGDLGSRLSALEGKGGKVGMPGSL